MRRVHIALMVFAFLLAGPVVADQPGQADLDMAADLQLTAETVGDLEKVIKLAESALQKGLDAGQQEFAKKLLAAALYQHANRYTETLMRRGRGGRSQTVRDQALKDLEKAKGYDASLPDVYLLEAKLRAIGGTPNDIRAAAGVASEAIRVLEAKDDPKQLSKAYILRAQLSEDQDRKLADFEAAVKADPGNTDASQALALLYVQKGDNDKAVATLQKLVEQEPENPSVLAALASTLTDLKKYDEALRYCDDIIKQAPQSTAGYNLRARVKAMKDDVTGAIKDLDEALKINEKDLQALLMRGTLHSLQGNDELGKADIDKVLRQEPDLPQAIVQRSRIAASKKRWGDAISDLQMVLQTDPTNPEYRILLASFYVGDSRPRKAVELLTQVLDSLDENDADFKDTKVRALAARGDALLSVGKHADAIKDYEEAVKVDPEDTHVLNNFAWVLATSPEDSVRNAERSIELGLKACELTKYEKPHILSTLAAGYAEKGDFESAKKWSAKAVELGAKDDDVDDQLKKELDGYKQGKPWREKQEVEENTKPIGRSKSDLET